MTDEPQASPGPLPYDKVRCRQFSRRVLKTGLDIEWNQLKRLNRIKHRGTKVEWDARLNELKMEFMPRIEKCESDQDKQENKPGAVRKRALENIAANVPADRRATMKADREWAGNSLNIPVARLEEPPSRRAVIILLSAEEDATFRRGLLGPEAKKQAKDSEDDHAIEPNGDDNGDPLLDEQTQRLIKRSAELEG